MPLHNLRLLTSTGLAAGLLLGLGFSACGGGAFEAGEDTEQPLGQGGAGGVTSNPAGGSSGKAGGGSGGAGSAGEGGAGSAGESGGDAGEGGGDAGSAGSDAGAGGGTLEGCDPAQGPLTDALFVSLSNQGNADGSQQKPFNSLVNAIATARTQGITQIYLDQGTYSEPVQIPADQPALSIEGGWKLSSGQWARTCDAAARSKTILASSKATGLRIEGITEPLTLRSLTVRSRSVGSSGESVYGLWVSEASAPVELQDVAIVAGDGGDGGTASNVESASNLCNGANDCSEGQPGNDGTDGTVATKPGEFDSSGYVPAHGSNGIAGTAGQNGQAGEDITKSCYPHKCECSVLMCKSKDQVSQRSQAKCGCGGKGGQGGGAGLGGGASVGVFLLGSTTQLKVTSSTIAAGNGGNGGKAASSNPGQPGNKRSDGLSVPCWGVCEKPSLSCVCSQADLNFQAKGGTDGGPGGKGGKGGAGAGGPSVAVVRVQGANFTLDPQSAVSYGTQGEGVDGAASGYATDVITVDASGEN